MDTNTNFTLQPGMTVYGSEGDKIGDIDVIEGDYFVVRKGFFFPEDHYIPFTAVQSVESEDVYLAVTKDDALNQNWNEAPAGTAESGTYVDETAIDTNYEDASAGVTDVETAEYVADDFDNRGVITDADYAGARNTDAENVPSDAVGVEYVDDDRNTESWGQGTLREDAGTPVSSTDVEHETVDVVEENLDYTKRDVDRGSVRVDKHVVEEQQSIDVPITEEEVHVNRRSVDRPVDNASFEDTTIDIPVHGEEVDVTKTARVVEEIDIDKSATERTETVTDTVRREEVEITGAEIEAENEDVLNDDRSLIDKAKDAVTPDDDTNRQ